ncbi:IS110 family transposase [Streptomyces griseochromogenes]|uniref:IS110 family transposase n=1 Tax=Streptomyces griseochromogenes TaxID=68214 RepID=UPI0037B4097B
MEEPVFDGIHQELKDTVRAWWPRPGGWQTFQFDHGLWEEDYPSALVGWTGAPACVADVSASDIALVTGLGTNGQRWQGWLNLNKAAALLTEEPEGYRQRLSWARAFKRLQQAGVECTGSYGAALTRYLHHEGITVTEVNRPDKAARRRHGKSDSLDAAAAARAVSGRATATAKTTD